MVALWGGIGALAVATGPSLGALLITGFGWRAAFYVNLPVGLVAWLVGRRVLSNAERVGLTSSPDYPGVVLLSGALALLVLAISEGPTWGWTSGADRRELRARRAALLPPFLFRSLRHAEPVLDLRLFRARSFSVANTAALLYSMGFFAMLLGNILFLTSVWHYSILAPDSRSRRAPRRRCRLGPCRQAGGPIRLSPRPARWVSASSHSASSGTCGASGLTPDYLSVWLPGTLIVGLGIGLTFPVISAAAVSSLEPARYSVGSAVNQTARQMGGALGVAILVVILGAPASAAAALTNFRHLWIYVAAHGRSRGRDREPARQEVPSPSLSGAELAVEEAGGLEEMLDGEIAIDPLARVRSAAAERA